MGDKFLQFFSYRICINSMEPFAGMFFAYVGNTIYSVIVEGKEKRKIKHMFSRYVSHNVVNELLRSPEKLSLGGKREKVTVLFSDIRNFSTMSEKMTPEQVVAMLNEYFTEMVNVVLKYDGTVDKFIGDAIMAVFGAPIKHNDDAKRACLTALEMREALCEAQNKMADRRKGFPRR